MMANSEWRQATRYSARMNQRPYISERLIDAFEAWVGYLNSGPTPIPAGHSLGSLESNAASGKYGGHSDAFREVVDINLGVKMDDAFRKLMPQQQVCIKTHVLWSCYSPLTGTSTDWPKMREHEAKHAALNEQAYELNLISAIAELERACG